MQDAGYGLPRTPLPGTWVNRGKEKGRGKEKCPGPAAYSERERRSPQLPALSRFTRTPLRPANAQAKYPTRVGMSRVTSG
jgi:hypothetical protein